MSRIRATATIGAVVACLILTCSQVVAATEKVLWNFCTHNDTCEEADFTDHGPLLMDAAGNIYGTSGAGTGKYHFGTVFRLSPDGGTWRHTTLYNFGKSDNKFGVKPIGALIMDTAGNLYGTTSEGGRVNHAGGTVFELMPPTNGGNAWKIKILYGFCAQRGCPDGATPHAGLTYAGAASGLPYDGVSPLFGTTYNGGKNGACVGFERCGVAYRLSFDGAAWKEDVLFTFCSETHCDDGSQPSGELVMDGLGNLFGTTEGGGTGKCGNPTCGTLFELSGSGGGWQRTTLYNFCSEASCTDGEIPQGGVIIDAAGNLFGTTKAGGTTRGGTLFKMTWDPEQQSWSYSTAYVFCSQKACKDGAFPEAGLVMDADGNLFGTTSDGGNSSSGTLYKFSQAGYSELYIFCARKACKDGKVPDTRLLLDQSGNLFGTTPFGGSDNHGVVFELTP